MRIVVHESIVVVPEELVAHRLAKNEAHGQQEKTADGPNPIDPHPPVGRPRRIRIPPCRKCWRILREAADIYGRPQCFCNSGIRDDFLMAACAIHRLPRSVRQILTI